MPRQSGQDPNYDICMKMFDYKCILCRTEFGVTVHELTPRSLAPKTWKALANRVPLCSVCHERIHNMSRKDRDDLLLPARERALKFYTGT